MPPELSTVAVQAAPLDRYRSLLGDSRWQDLEQAMREYCRAVRGRVVWNLNSTARGGGVAELLAALLPYERGAGVDARWAVIEAETPFFSVTKRLHSLLHGVAADGPEISREEQAEYERTLAGNADAVRQLVKAGDVVILHDPQTAGLAPALARHGCRVIWRCHIGVDEPDDVARRAWDFLRPYVASADAVVFSRRAYAWEGLAAERTVFIAPAIDAFTPKNQELDAEMVQAILRAAGLQAPAHDGAAASFVRQDGSTSKVERQAKLLQELRPSTADPLVVQVSRWDHLKDPVGVLEAFASQVAPSTDAQLVLAGPSVASVADDPEQPEILAELEQRWRRLPANLQRRVHVAQLPMDDEEENAAIVNALQRQARIVVQKSLAEGFGLTVAEAMWKGRPVVASHVGGIEDQIEDGRSGVLVDDPRDLDGFGRAVAAVLRDPATAEGMGKAARERVRERFLAPRHLQEQAALIRRLVS